MDIQFRMGKDLAWLRQRLEAVTATTFEGLGPLNQLVHLLLLHPDRHFLQPEETAIINNLPPVIDTRGGSITKVLADLHP